MASGISSFARLACSQARAAMKGRGRLFGVSLPAMDG
jgi:hypothetical protein